MADEPNAVVTDGEVAAEANPNAEADGTQAGEAKPVNWEKRYSDSSNEARKLFQEKTELESRLRTLEQTRSLTEQQTQAQAKSFVPRDQFKRYWVEKGMTEDAADAFYERDSSDFQQKQFLSEQVQALSNRLKFKEQQDQLLATESNPDIKKATEFWNDNPAMSALPVSDQLTHYRKAMAKIGGTASGRDLSAVKAAAGGSVGGGGSRAASSTSDEDAAAQAVGIPNGRAMKELNQTVRTSADYAAWQKKWKVS